MRRTILRGTAGLATSAILGRTTSSAAAPPSPGFRRPRPGEPGWPFEAAWRELDRRVDGTLVRPTSPFAAEATSSERATALAQIGNPFFLGEHPALTQTSGWLDAWRSTPSAWALDARHAGDVVEAVRFAAAHRLRLVVRGGGHSYHGASNAPDSLLVRTRGMRDVTLHDAFVAQGCEATASPVPAVSLGAGALWLDAYDAVTTGAGRYVQGGGCTSVGVPGLLLGGGFGSFSKRWGLAAANLLEAELVTADGVRRTVNACTEPDLFWALKGGGGAFGVIVRVTLRTHALPDTFGAVFGAIRAQSESAWRRLVEMFLVLCRDRLLTPHWGEIVRFRPDRTLSIGMVFQGLSENDAREAWQGLVEAVAAAPNELAFAEPLQILSLPARRLWDAAWLRSNAPGLVRLDERADAQPGRFFWAGDAGQVGQSLHGYDSVWLPQALLRDPASFAAAIVDASRLWPVAFHLNKGLAGAAPEAIAASRDTSVHPAVIDAFALAILGASGPPAFDGLPGAGTGAAAQASRSRERVRAAADRLRALVPEAAAYVWESDHFQPDWQRAFWGPNYARLLAVKRRVDPNGLFVHHHSVGSEDWSEDGFTRLG